MSFISRLSDLAKTAYDRFTGLERLHEASRQLDERMAQVYNGPATAEFFLPDRLKGDSFKDPYRQHAWIYACVRAAADNVSKTPVTLKAGNKKSSVIVDSPSDAWWRLLQRPCPRVHQDQFYDVTTVHLERAGACVWIKESLSGQPVGRSEVPFELWPFSGRCFSRVLDEKTKKLTHWMFVAPGSGRPIFYLSDQLCWIKYPDPDDLLGFLSPMDVAERSARTDWKASVFDEAFFDNDATPGGILVSASRLTPAQRKEIRAAWEERHKGVGRNAKVALLEGGLTWTQNQVDHTKMQFGEKRRYSREEIAGIYKTPLSILMQYENLTFASARSADANYQSNKVEGLYRRIEAAAKSDLFGDLDPHFLEFDRSVVPVLEEARTQKLDNARKLLEQGRTLNEVNEALKLGLPPLPPEIGDVRFIGQGLLVLEGLLAPEPKPELVAPEPVAPAEDEEPVERQHAHVIEAFVTRQPKKHAAAWHAMRKRVFDPLEDRLYGRVRRWAFEVRAEALGSLGKLARYAKRVSEGEVFDLERAVKKLLSGADPVYRRAVEAAMEQSFEEVGNFSDVDPSDERVLEIVKKRKALLSETPGKLRSRVTRSITEGLEAGEGVDQIAKRIKQDFSAFTSSKALTVARTEVAGAANEARFEVFREEGVVKHAWVTAHDEAVRDSHAAQDGQVVKVGEEFDNGLLYPGDPNGDASETINCRCIVVAA